jgi:hypothetical protein
LEWEKNVTIAGLAAREVKLGRPDQQTVAGSGIDQIKGGQLAKEKSLATKITGEPGTADLVQRCSLV